MSSADLLPLALDKARALDIEPPVDLTGVDRLGVPIWKAVRPEACDAKGNVTMLNGKAWNPRDAKLGAVMEAIERHYGERPACVPRVAAPSVLIREKAAYVPLAEVPLAHGVSDPGDVPLAWFEGHDHHGVPVLIPAHDIQCPYRGVEGAANPIAWRSTGLAAGANETEATLYGLLEVIERDAWAVARVSRCGQRVDVRSSPSERIQRLLNRLAELEINLEVHKLDSIGGVHTYVAAVRDTERGGDVLPDYGLCAHPDPYLALELAIVEALQSRLVVMTEARQDSGRLARQMERARKDGRRGEDAWLPTQGQWLEPARATAPLPENLAMVVDGIVDRLLAQGFARVLKIRMNPADDPLAVVRVVVPGASEAMHRAFWLGQRIRMRP